MNRFSAPLLIGLLLLAPCLARAAEPASADAVEVATDWLSLVDAGTYEESWRQSGALFRQAITKEQWSQALGAARTSLGELRTRRLESRTEATALPGVPDGRYVVMQFAAPFASRAPALETVTTALEADGHWRVVGYFIK